MDKMENRRTQYDLADILRENKQYLNSYNLFEQQRKAFGDICACRTSELNGHTCYCNSCNYQRQAYNSCRNKHCPKCQFTKQAKWVDKLQAKLLDCKHFHIVFTIPHLLNPLFYLNQKKLYDALFQSAWQAVSKAASNPKFLGAQTGAVAVLHTWTQT
ncbi:transposase zinc-binding domain-containing protein, partial [Labilibaculum sp. K2S]|uniref:IS91 family transposase n=1 Tax=Labilibaculum sp. K2S TaxID=3056386 RepID=UPI003FA5E229|nr:transposase zinc-binding domain-containing protein [Labilibaculum sp. K2S]